MTWFSPWIERQRVGQAYSFGRKIGAYRSDIVVRNPEFEALDRAMLNTEAARPVYPLTEGLSVRWLRNVINLALDAWGDDPPDSARGHRQDHGLMTLARASLQTHFPNNQEQLDAALRRLSFDEFLLLQLGVLAARRQFQGVPAKPLHAGSEKVVARSWAPALRAHCRVRAAGNPGGPPQGTTDGPAAAGDVETGKDGDRALRALDRGGNAGRHHGADRVLAEQHARSGRMFGPLTRRPAKRVQVLLLTGSMSPAERQEALEVATGAAHLSRSARSSRKTSNSRTWH